MVLNITHLPFLEHGVTQQTIVAYFFCSVFFVLSVMSSVMLSVLCLHVWVCMCVCVSVHVCITLADFTVLRTDR